jgi:predicted nucleic-acid-binding Zn-ribbon protein
MSEPQSTACPKCGSMRREAGKLAGGFGPVRFLPNGFGEPAKMVAAVACLKCGNVEMVLEDALPFPSAAVEHPSLRRKNDNL